MTHIKITNNHVFTASCVTAVMIILKLLGGITWPWMWILSILWIPQLVTGWIIFLTMIMIRINGRGKNDIG